MLGVMKGPLATATVSIVHHLRGTSSYPDYAEPVARVVADLDFASQALTGLCSVTACRISRIRGPGRVTNISSTSSGTGWPKALK